MERVKGKKEGLSMIIIVFDSKGLGGSDHLLS